MTQIFTIAQWFGIPSFGNKISLLWAVIVLAMLMSIEGVALWRILSTLAGVATHTDDGRKLNLVCLDESLSSS